MTARYEALRTAALGGLLPLEARSGLALLLRRGLWAWARAASAPNATPRPPPPPASRPTAVAERRSVIHLFAAMAMSFAEPSIHE